MCRSKQNHSRFSRICSLSFSILVTTLAQTRTEEDIISSNNLNIYNFIISEWIYIEPLDVLLALINFFSCIQPQNKAD